MWLPSGVLRIKHTSATHECIILLLKFGRFNLILSEIESAGLRISEFPLTEVRGQMKYDFPSLKCLWLHSEIEASLGLYKSLFKKKKQV